MLYFQFFCGKFLIHHQLLYRPIASSSITKFWMQMLSLINFCSLVKLWGIHLDDNFLFCKCMCIIFIMVLQQRDVIASISSKQIRVSSSISARTWSMFAEVHAVIWRPTRSSLLHLENALPTYKQFVMKEKSHLMKKLIHCG